MASFTFEAVIGSVVVEDGLKSEMAYPGMSVAIYGTPILVAVAHGAKAVINLGGEVLHVGSGGVLKVGGQKTWGELIGTLPGATQDQIKLWTGQLWNRVTGRGASGYVPLSAPGSNATIGVRG
jgi:hypothetical protein